MAPQTPSSACIEARRFASSFQISDCQLSTKRRRSARGRASRIRTGLLVPCWWMAANSFRSVDVRPRLFLSLCAAASRLTTRGSRSDSPPAAASPPMTRSSSRTTASSKLPRSMAAPTREFGTVLEMPNRWAPCKFRKPRSPAARARRVISSTPAGSTSRSRMRKRFPESPPSRRGLSAAWNPPTVRRPLCPLFAWLLVSRPRALLSGRQRVTNCEVTATLSLAPE
mmetsp:Transcript_40259/g.90367  ORF Transcript_40259/g.90367 Transcript_40259/m.90367 type:complete len:226 (+) Transcript_40259:643-1320(+)